MSMFEVLNERYVKGTCREDQLDRYVALGKITEQEKQEIIESKQVSA